MIPVYIQSRITWEHDFICNDLLEGLSIQIFPFDSMVMEEEYGYPNEESECSPWIERCILIVDGYTTDLISLVSQLKPAFLFFVSDEHEVYQKLAKGLMNTCSKSEEKEELCVLLIREKMTEWWKNHKSFVREEIKSVYNKDEQGRIGACSEHPTRVDSFGQTDSK